MNTSEDVPVHRSGKLDRSGELFIVQTIFMVLSAVCVLIRGYVKYFIVRANMLEDYLIYGAMVSPLPCSTKIPKDVWVR